MLRALLFIFYLICAHLSLNYTLWVIEIVNHTVSRILTSNILILNKTWGVFWCRMLWTVNWFFHVDSYLKQKKPQSVYYTGFNITVFLKDKDSDLYWRIRILFQLNYLIKEFFKMIFKRSPVLLVFKVFSEGNIKIESSLRFRVTRRRRLGTFYDSFAFILTVMNAKSLIWEWFEWSSISWHFYINYTYNFIGKFIFLFIQIKILLRIINEFIIFLPYKIKLCKNFYFLFHFTHKSTTHQIGNTILIIISNCVILWNGLKKIQNINIAMNFFQLIT